MASLSSPEARPYRSPAGGAHKRSRYQLNSTRPHGPPRTHLSTPKHNFELLASRTLSQAAWQDSRSHRFPASPLDSIDPSLYPRFPRFSVTTDNSLPDLSTDEVTSTRISEDEECIVASDDSATTGTGKTSRRKRLQEKFHNAVTSPLDMKRVGDRIKRVPSFLRSKPQRLLRRSISESQVQPERELRPVSTRHTSDLPATLRSLQSIDLNTRPLISHPTRYQRPTYMLSDLPEDQASDSEPPASQYHDPLPPGTPRSFELSIPSRPSSRERCASITTTSSYHTARELPSRRGPVSFGQAGYLVAAAPGVPRSLSLGSIDEQSSHSIYPSQFRAISMPILPYPRPFLRYPLSLTGRPPRILSVYDNDHLSKIEQLQREPMFVDLQGSHQVNFVFPRSCSFKTRPPSSQQSLCSRRDTDSPMLFRCSSTTNRVEQSFGKSKVPLFVPSQIIKPAPFEPEDFSPPEDTPIPADNTIEITPPSTIARPSKESISCASDWSTTVQFESTQEEIRPSSEPNICQQSPDILPRITSSLSMFSASLSMKKPPVLAIPAVDGHRSDADLVQPISKTTRRQRLIDGCLAGWRRLKYHIRERSMGWERSKVSLPMG